MKKRKIKRERECVCMCEGGDASKKKPQKRDPKKPGIAKKIKNKKKQKKKERYIN